jgi:hypothetical protein
MNRPPPIIDMLPDGSFVEQPRPGRVPISAKVMLGGILVAAVAVSVTVAALAIWLVSLLLPVIILSAAVAWAAFKFRQWQLFRGYGRRGRGLGPRQPGGFGQ